MVYLSILLIIWSSTEPTLFHAGCRPSLHVDIHLLQHLYLTMRGTHPTTLSKRPSTHIWPCEERIQHTCKKGFALTFDHVRNQSNVHVKKALHLRSTMWGTNPTYMSKGLSGPGWGFLVTDQMPPFSQRMAFNTYIWSCGNTSLNHIRMA